MLATPWQSFARIIRQLRRNPGFVIATVITLAVGVGTTTAIFSVVDGILLRRLSFPGADQLVAIDTLDFPEGASAMNAAAADHIRSSYPDYLDWRDQNHTFQSLASCSRFPRLFSHRNGEDARVISAARVSADLFFTLGVAPLLGRWFTSEEDKPGHRAVILSYELWVSDFASSPNAIGQTVLVSDEPSTIVGVMPKGFHFPVDTPAYFWASSAADAEGPFPKTSQRDWDGLSIIGRLKTVVRSGQALADLNTIQLRLAHVYPENRNKLAVSVTPLLDESVSDVQSGLHVLSAAVILLLLISCANVAGLLLVRVHGRRPELVLCNVLGASRLRIIGQLLLESLVLALTGGAFGIFLAFGLIRAAAQFIPSDFPRLYNVNVDLRVLAFAILISAVSALLFSLLPALKSAHLDPIHTLREGALSTVGSTRHHRLHQALIVAETALTFSLLVGAGLLIRTVMNVRNLEPGFDRQRTVSFDIALTKKRYPDPAKVTYLNKLIPQLAAIPGVERVSAVHPLPLFWPQASWSSFTIPGHPTSRGEATGAVEAVAMPGYFETLSIPLLSGRTFAAQDNDAKSPAVAIVNQSFARKYFPAEDPIGRYFTPEAGAAGEPRFARRIVGIVGDTRTGDLWNPCQPEFFLPYAQDPTHQRPIIVMKVAGDPTSYENVARRIVATADPDAPLFRYRTLAQEIETQAIEPRFEAWVVSVFACVALLLSAIGLFAVLSYAVAQRTRELGLRMALGASRGEVLRLVLRRGVGLALIGTAGGCVISLCASRLIDDLLFNVAPSDAVVFSSVIVAVVLVSLVASLVPSLRAASIEPMRCLRTE